MHDADDFPVAQAIAEPEVKKSRQFSIVWVIPMLAALIGIWLAVKTIRETGPTITISFKSAEGLVPGKTEIKYKDVSVGKVDRIELSEDLSQVMITAVMSRDIGGHLTKDARFWIVRARVAAGEVSGIGTLLTGAYIGMIPGSDGKPVYRFEGSEKPPAVPQDTPGRRFNLRAEQLGSLDIGSPVYYRQVRVGQVTHVDMAADGSAVLLKVFVEAPYHHQVKQNSRFYNASGLDVSINADGVRIDTPSLASLVVGGVSFISSDDPKAARPVYGNQVFTLYQNRDEAIAAAFTYREYYLVYFEEAVRGLSKGAPVNFHGIKVGEVVSIRLLFDQDQLTFSIPVLIAIEPDRIELVGELAIPEYQVMEALVDKGLRAQQRTGNLLTGQSYVSLSIHPDAAPQKIGREDVYPVLPSIPNPMGEITTSAKRVLERIHNLPLDETLNDIREAARHVTAMTGSKSLENAIKNIEESFANFKRVTASLNDETLNELNGTLAQATKTLAQGGAALDQAGSVLGETAPAVYNLNRLLLELQDTARSIRGLTDYLERHPDAIVFGKGDEK